MRRLRFSIRYAIHYTCESTRRTTTLSCRRVSFTHHPLCFTSSHIVLVESAGHLSKHLAHYRSANPLPQMPASKRRAETMDDSAPRKKRHVRDSTGESKHDDPGHPHPAVKAGAPNNIQQVAAPPGDTGEHVKVSIVRATSKFLLRRERHSSCCKVISRYFARPSHARSAKSSSTNLICSPVAIPSATDV